MVRTCSAEQPIAVTGYQEHLGHVSITVTMDRYSHLYPQVRLRFGTESSHRNGFDLSSSRGPSADRIQAWICLVPLRVRRTVRPQIDGLKSSTQFDRHSAAWAILPSMFPNMTAWKGSSAYQYRRPMSPFGR